MICFATAENVPPRSTPLDAALSLLVDQATTYNKLALDKIVHAAKNYRAATAAGYLASHAKHCLAVIEEIKKNLPPFSKG